MRSKWIAIAAKISLMLLFYTLSYAPYFRGFEPVEWLIDFTPIYHPMVAWTDLGM